MSTAAEEDQDLQNIRTEALIMAQDKEVRNMIIQERYNRMDWTTYGNQKKREGKVEGGIDMLEKQIKKKWHEICLLTRS